MSVFVQLGTGAIHPDNRTLCLCLLCVRMCLCLCFSNEGAPLISFVTMTIKLFYSQFLSSCVKVFCIKLHFLFYFGEPMFLVHCLEFCFLYSSVMILFSHVSFSPVVSTPLINLLYMYSCSLSFCLCRGGSSLSSHVSQWALALRLTNVVESFQFLS